MTKADEWNNVQVKLDSGDAIGALCLAIKLSGLTMTLHGNPINETELRIAATDEAIRRIERIALTNERIEG